MTAGAGRGEGEGEGDEMKATWFGDQRRYEFARTIEAATGGSGWSAFSEFLTVASGSLRQAQQIARTGTCSVEIERDVLLAQKKMRRPELCAKAFGQLVDMLDSDRTDVLGVIYQELGSNSKQAGQFFTPHALCESMAKIAAHDLVKPTGRPARIAEPAVGSGAMVIALVNELRKAGWRRDEFVVYATDIDWRCCAMAFIQFSLLDIPAVVYRGNSLLPDECVFFGATRGV